MIQHLSFSLFLLGYRFKMYHYIRVWLWAGGRYGRHGMVLHCKFRFVLKEFLGQAAGHVYAEFRYVGLAGLSYLNVFLAYL